MKRLALAALLCTSALTAHAQTPAQQNLLNVGVNSALTWSRCDSTPKPRHLDVYAQALSEGWAHINFIVCAAEDFPNDSLDTLRVRNRAELLKLQISTLQAQYPDRAYIVTFKGYAPIGGWDVKGVKTTELYHRIETSAHMQAQYLAWWREVAEVFKDKPEVAFSIMNEPEWHNTWGALRKWNSLAVEAVDTIRAVNPQRWIIVEGTHKSLIERKPVAEIMPLIPRQRIIYGFHWYGNSKDLHFAHRIQSHVDTVSTHSVRRGRRALDTVIDWGRTHGVPVSITETGMEVSVAGQGVAQAARADFFAQTLGYYRKRCGTCGITWWAIGDTKTPYLRSTPHKTQPQRIPDPLLNTALGIQP